MNIEFRERPLLSNLFKDKKHNDSNGPWQISLTNIHDRLGEIYKNGQFTDITLIFPGSEITFSVHRLILAIISPVFEGILYGPHRTEGRNVELHDDDPLIMQYAIAHCYGMNHFKIPDMETALELYKLADKYILEQLKKYCGEHIVSHMDEENVKNVMDFANHFDFMDLKSQCLPYLKKVFDDTRRDKDCDLPCYWGPRDESKYPLASTYLMEFNEDWVDVLLPEVKVKVLDFNESWTHPKDTLKGSRLSKILSSNCHLDKFYGCIDAETVHQFPLEHTGRNSKTLELCLSVVSPLHAKSVIEAINQQNRFKKHLIALHISCGAQVWPSNWPSIPPERTHRPSILLISDVDDDKITWVIEAAKALLPQEEGAYGKLFRKYRYDANGNKYINTLKTVNILKLPRSKLTQNGIDTLVKGLITPRVIFTRLIIQSSFVKIPQNSLIRDSGTTIQLLPIELNLFKDVFDDLPPIKSIRET